MATWRNLAIGRPLPRREKQLAAGLRHNARDASRPLALTRIPDQQPYLQGYLTGDSL